MPENRWIRLAGLVALSGLVASLSTAASASPGPGKPAALRATLSWPTRANDLELHLVRNGGHINSTSDDCTWFTCVGKVLDWGRPGESIDDPTKDADIVGEAGVENITLAVAPEGTYHLLVEYWGTGDTTSPTVELVVHGQRIAAPRIRGFEHHHVWYVGSISFPGGQFTPKNQIIDCRSDWPGPGCGLALPHEQAGKRQ